MNEETLKVIADVNLKLKKAYGVGFTATNEEESKIIDAMELFIGIEKDIKEGR